MTRLMMLSELRGKYLLAPLIRFYVFHRGVNLIFLLGNIVSPNIVSEIAGITGVRVYGLTGNLDDASITSVLKDFNGYFDGRCISVDEKLVCGIGSSIHTSYQKLQGMGGVDVLLSYYPGVRHGCGGYGVDYIDELIDQLDPELVVFGGCREAFIRGRICSPGYGFRGGVLLIDVDRGVLDVRIDSLYSILEELLVDAR